MKHSILIYALCLAWIPTSLHAYFYTNAENTIVSNHKQVRAQMQCLNNNADKFQEDLRKNAKSPSLSELDRISEKYPCLKEINSLKNRIRLFAYGKEMDSRNEKLQYHYKEAGKLLDRLKRNEARLKEGGDQAESIKREIKKTKYFLAQQKKSIEAEEVFQAESPEKLSLADIKMILTHMSRNTDSHDEIRKQESPFKACKDQTMISYQDYEDNKQLIHAIRQNCSLSAVSVLPNTHFFYNLDSNVEETPLASFGKDLNKALGSLGVLEEVNDASIKQMDANIKILENLKECSAHLASKEMNKEKYFRDFKFNVGETDPKDMDCFNKINPYYQAAAKNFKDYRLLVAKHLSDFSKPFKEGDKLPLDEFADVKGFRVAKISKEEAKKLNQAIYDEYQSAITPGHANEYMYEKMIPPTQRSKSETQKKLAGEKPYPYMFPRWVENSQNNEKVLKFVPREAPLKEQEKESAYPGEIGSKSVRGNIPRKKLDSKPYFDIHMGQIREKNQESAEEQIFELMTRSPLLAYLPEANADFLDMDKAIGKLLANAKKMKQAEEKRKSEANEVKFQPYISDYGESGPGGRYVKKTDQEKASDLLPLILHKNAVNKMLEKKPENCAIATGLYNLYENRRIKKDLGLAAVGMIPMFGTQALITGGGARVANVLARSKILCKFSFCSKKRAGMLVGGIVGLGSIDGLIIHNRMGQLEDATIAARSGIDEKHRALGAADVVKTIQGELFMDLAFTPLALIGMGLSKPVAKYYYRVAHGIDWDSTMASAAKKVIGNKNISKEAGEDLLRAIDTKITKMLGRKPTALEMDQLNTIFEVMESKKLMGPIKANNATQAELKQLYSKNTLALAIDILQSGDMQHAMKFLDALKTFPPAKSRLEIADRFSVLRRAIQSKYADPKTIARNLGEWKHDPVRGLNAAFKLAEKKMEKMIQSDPKYRGLAGYNKQKPSLQGMQAYQKAFDDALEELGMTRKQAKEGSCCGPGLCRAG